MKKRIAATLICLLLLFSGCRKPDGKPEVRIAFFPNITHAQALVMKSSGSLEARLGEDYSVEWISFNAGPAVIESMFAGEIDIAYIGPVPSINAYVKSQGDVRVVAGACNGGAVLVVSPDSGITNVLELSGHTVAIPQLGNTQHLQLLMLLDANGLKSTSEGGTVNVTAVANADVQSLMDRGDVDAALVPEPWGSLLESKCGAIAVLDADRLWNEGKYATTVVLVRKDFLMEHPEIVEQFLEEHHIVTGYIGENTEESKIMINEQITLLTGKAIPGEVLDRAFSRLVITDEIEEKSIEEYAILSLEGGFIQNLPDDKMIDTSILERIS
jgi:NitT/TauT family transport system substrate-binding protein